MEAGVPGQSKRQQGQVNHLCVAVKVDFARATYITMLYLEDTRAPEAGGQHVIRFVSGKGYSLVQRLPKSGLLSPLIRVALGVC